MKELADTYGIDIETLKVMHTGSFQEPYFFSQLTCDVPGKPHTLVQITFRRGLMTWFEKPIPRDAIITTG